MLNCLAKGKELLVNTKKKIIKKATALKKTKDSKKPYKAGNHNKNEDGTAEIVYSSDLQTAKAKTFSQDSTRKGKKGIQSDGPFITGGTGGDDREAIEPHPRRARKSSLSDRDKENTKAEKPKKRPRAINIQPQSVKKKELQPQLQNADNVCGQSIMLIDVTQSNMVTTHKDIGGTSYSCPIMETACEKAFISEGVVKGAPNIESFFASANPFSNENDMLDISDTIFDVTNDFPTIFLGRNARTLQFTGDLKQHQFSLKKYEKYSQSIVLRSGAVPPTLSILLSPNGVWNKKKICSTKKNMLLNRRPLVANRQQSGKKRVDIVYKSKWITNNFVVGDPLGAGSFGKVWTVECRKKPSQLYALKVPAPGFNPKHIAMELKVLRTISGGPNVVEFIAAYRELDRVFVVMNYFPHDDIFSLIHKMPLDETLQYMRNLFIALHHIHRYRVIHRDVKPANFLYNRSERRYLLVDFGLSHFEISKESQSHPSPTSKENNSDPIDPPLAKRKRLSDDVLTPTRSGILKHPKCGCSSFSNVCDSCGELPIKRVNKAGTPGYRAPEVLLRFDEQTTEIDVFAAGVTMLSFLLKKHPIFRPANDVEALAQMATFLGSSSLVEAAAEGGITLLCDPSIPGMDMVKFINNFSKDIREAQGCTTGCRSCMALIYQNNSGFCFCKHSERESISRLKGLERVAFEVLNHSLNPSPSRRYTARMLADLIDPPSMETQS
ncbi:kinase domain protein [Dictyocaulus viviparus]|uniref:non-specific serine/threonine protein kinase n=1 Tax=Dictyocaulus viviparus TaxID=29172 RepID=A0A0D8XJY3_DICVI|nr:kinase domain protein [Dictyocaulus viviparus]